MKISVRDIRENDCDSDALILPCVEKAHGLYDFIGPSFSQVLKKVFSREFPGRLNDILLIPAPDNIRAQRICLVGLGDKEEITSETVRQAGGKAAVYLREKRMSKIALSTRVLSSLKVSPADFIEGALLGLYTFGKFRTQKENGEIRSFSILSRESQELRSELIRAESISSSVCFTRDLVNTPANEMTPSDLARAALSLKNKNLSVRILERRDVEKLGMHAYLSVAKGSNQPLKFIILEYTGAKEAPIVLIGKSVTFDSGGISIKPSEGLEKMKYDMAGGAAVLAVMRSVAELKLPVHLIGILPATENLLGGSASRPGDVVRAIGGKTIEIISTDAEGRMTLADAIGFAKRYEPRAIVDIATLTGACAIALGNAAIGMMGNDRYLLDKMKQSGESVYERVWELPLFKEYKEYLKSDVADLKNSGGRQGSLSASASFLNEFAGNTKWVHLDIAGTAYHDKDKPYTPKGATGIGVRLLFKFILNFI
ncbi:MAG TPA: leucyl aminopeptidase [Thermodesulfovibrionales bacterium]|nr:leucyl aminopeptidase [Thermodesulfovibrionales bacterium]